MNTSYATGVTRVYVEIPTHISVTWTAAEILAASDPNPEDDPETARPGEWGSD